MTELTHSAIPGDDRRTPAFTPQDWDQTPPVGGPPAMPIGGGGNEAAAADGRGPRRRRHRRNLGLALLCIVLMLGSFAASVWSRGRFADASDARAQAASMDLQRAQLGDQAEKDERDRVALETIESDARNAIDAVGQSMSDAMQSQNHYADVANQAADLQNHGHGSSAADLLKGKGATALTDFEAKVSALDIGLTSERTNVQRLQEVAR